MLKKSVKIIIKNYEVLNLHKAKKTLLSHNSSQMESYTTYNLLLFA